MADPKQNFNLSAMLVSNLLRSSDLPDLTEEIIALAFKALEISQTAEVIEVAIRIVGRLNHNQEALKEALAKFKKTAQQRVLLSLLATATCPAIDESLKLKVLGALYTLDERVRAIFSSCWTEQLTEQQHKELESRLAAEPQGLERRRELARVFGSHQSASVMDKDEPPDVDCGSAPQNNKLDSEKPAATPANVRPEYQESISTVHCDASKMRPACRKCSRNACDNVESTPCTFKICSGCRLAVYCNRGKEDDAYQLCCAAPACIC